MIFAVKALQQSLDNLKAIPELKEKILEMERAGIDVTIEPAWEPQYNVSHQHKADVRYYVLHILSKGDDLIAQRLWGVTGTKEENSIAHELGHVYFDYLTYIKKQPIPPCPPTMSAEDCEARHSEIIARTFDSFSRPAGIVIPLSNLFQSTPPSERPEPIMCMPPERYVVRQGDSLSSIAKLYYGDPNKWPLIYNANRDVIGGNSNLIRPRQPLVIPPRP